MSVSTCLSVCVCVGSCWWAVYRRTVAWLLRSASWRRPACGASPRCSSWYASSSAASCLRVKRRRCTATRATGRRNGSSGTASISCARKGSAGRVANRPVFPGTSRISRDVPYFRACVPSPGLGLPGTQSVPYFREAKVQSFWCDATAVHIKFHPETLKLMCMGREH